MGPGEHEPVAEQKIKTVKERVRVFEHKLPFVMTVLLLVWCVYFCVGRLNMQFTSTHPQGPPPRELFTGWKVNANIDLRHGFAECAQCKVRDTNNSMQARTGGCTLLAPTGNVTGSSHMLHLETGKVIIGDQYTVIPMPDVVVTAINDQAAKA